MKSILKIMVCIPLYLLSSSISQSSEVGTIREHINPIEAETAIEEEVKIDPKSHNHFLNAIGHMESGNRYNIVNKWGYMGKYQFGRSTLQTLGYNITRTEFLSNPQIQEEAMYKLLKYNKYTLKYYISNYDGKKVWGVNITESGLLAAAHLAGSGNVKRFFQKGLDFKDANGTKMTSYMKQFGGYKLNI
jgi:hypothetical protein